MKEIFFTFILQMKRQRNFKNPSLTKLRKRCAHPEMRPGDDRGGWAHFVPSSGGVGLAGG